MLKKGVLFAAVSLCWFSYHAHATILLTEPFSYADGALTAGNAGANVSGGNWTLLSGTTTPLTISGGQLVGLSHGSGSREDAARAFSATDITTGTVFASFTLTVATAPTAGSDYFFALHPLANTNFRGRIFLAAPAVAGSTFRLGLENDSAPATVFTPDLSTGTYSVLLSVNAATNLSSLWVGADLSSFVEGAPTISDTVAPTTVNGVARVALRQGTGITVANSVSVDDIRVADSFSDATSPVPEPSSLLCTLGGVGILCGFRRLRSRHSPTPLSPASPWSPGSHGL